MPVSRVALDTNYIYSLKVSELRAIRNMGLLISIPTACLQEVWARSIREDNPAVLWAPIRRLEDFVDPDRPLLLHGAELRDSIGSPTDRRRRVARSLADQSGRTTWRGILADCGDQGDRWRRYGSAITEENHGFAEDVLLLDKELNPWIKELAKEKPLPRADLVRRIRQLSSGAASGLGARRLDAYYAVRALRAVEQGLGARTATANDIEDVTLLTHLAQPALVLTWDLPLIADVDASRSHQAPWIRTFGELVTEPLPSGNPLGTRLRYGRRTRDELNLLEREVRKRFL